VIDRKWMLFARLIYVSRLAETNEVPLPQDHIPRAEQRPPSPQSDVDAEVRKALTALLELADSLKDLDLEGVAPAFVSSGWQ
jgi:hypothetical protein